MTYLNNFTLPAELLEQITSEGLDFLPELVRFLINAATQIDREKYLGAGHYERTPERRGHANGFKPKTIYISPSSPWENAYIVNSGLKCPLNRGLKSPLFIGENVHWASFLNSLTCYQIEWCNSWKDRATLESDPSVHE
jgi:hypothetical protein